METKMALSIPRIICKEQWWKNIYCSPTRRRDLLLYQRFRSKKLEWIEAVVGGSCQRALSYEASHRNQHEKKLFITHTWTDDRDLRATATFKDTEAHAALSSSSNSGISSSWHSLGVLTPPSFCLYNFRSAYSPRADKLTKDIVRVQGEGLAERTLSTS